jgi:tetratricopeptide (TPR) repeat protein
MSVVYASVKEGGSQKDKKTEDVKRKLSSVLKRLKKDDKNADLWLEAAKLYLALGDLEKAVKCGEACLRIDPKRRAAKLLLTKVRKQEEARKAEAEAEEPTEAPEEEPEEEEEVIKAEPVEEIRYRGPLLWVPEEERPRFKSEEEALEQLRRELSPSSTVTCPDCNTLLEVEAAYCYGCGREMKEKLKTLEQRIETARSRLEENERDTDALFTIGAYLATNGQLDEAIEVLNRLTMVDQAYPGLWWLKARVFEQMGKHEAAQSSMRRAIQLESESG